MWRVWRMLVNAVTIGSLLLCLALTVLWVRSYWRYDLIRWGGPNRNGARSLIVNVESGGGGVRVLVGSHSPDSARARRAQGWAAYSYGVNSVPYIWGWATNPWGLGYASERRGPLHWDAVAFPTWLAAALFALLPAARLVLWIRCRRRRREGHCRECGYDLRATPEHCPECGAIPTTANARETKTAP